MVCIQRNHHMNKILSPQTGKSRLWPNMQYITSTVPTTSLGSCSYFLLQLQVWRWLKLSFMRGKTPGGVPYHDHRIDVLLTKHWLKTQHCTLRRRVEIRRQRCPRVCAWVRGGCTDTETWNKGEEDEGIRRKINKLQSVRRGMSMKGEAMGGERWERWQGWSWKLVIRYSYWSKNRTDSEVRLLRIKF